MMTMNKSKSARQRRQAIRIVLLLSVFVLVGCPNPTGNGGNDTTPDTEGESSLQFIVSYDGNGATSGTAPSDQTKTEGTDLTLAANSGGLARNGFSFAGWNTATDGTGTSYAESATYAADTDLTLYAQWTANTYTVSFNSQGGTGGSASVSATFGQSMPAATPPTKANVVFDGYYTGPSGTGMQYYTAAMESARDWDLSEDTELTASWRPYDIGDTGPAGGLIFYDDEDDGIDDIADARYLEAAPVSTEWTLKPWGGHNTAVSAAREYSVGTGAANTQAIVARFGNNEPYDGRADYAAKLAADLVHGGYDDWFLPSNLELSLIRQNLVLNGQGGFSSPGSYWSSTEYAANAAYRHGFPNSSGYTSKFVEASVRAVRAF